jgi:hypothetical protein
VTDTSLRATLRRVLRELTVVVVGVFIALASESWWSQREARRMEHEILQDMLDEFDENLAILASDLAANDTAHARISSLDALSDRELQDLGSAELIGRLGVSPVWQGFDPEMGTAQALVESGTVASITDRDLRLHLAKWSGLLEERRRFNLQAVSFQHDRVMPVIARASADLELSATERREVQILFRTLSNLHTYVMENQRRLMATAQDIQRYLREQVQD